MSELVKVLRLAKLSTGRRQEGWRDIHMYLSRMVGDVPPWWGLPGPYTDYHVHLEQTINIHPDEVCGVVDTGQLAMWWPAWALNALASADAQHDVVLEVYTLHRKDVRVGGYQTVFNTDDAIMRDRITLAGSGMSADDIRQHLDGQASSTVARFDQWGMHMEAA